MNYLFGRLIVWLIVWAINPLPLGLLPLSFRVEVLEEFKQAAESSASVTESTPLQILPALPFITAAPALPPTERILGPEWTERVLGYLEKAEKKETDPWLRDDIRIAWIAASWSQFGVPEWSLHRNFPPYAAATYQVLHCLPEEVRPRIVAARKAKLGSEYARWYGANDTPPKGANAIPEAAVASLQVPDSLISGVVTRAGKARRKSAGTGVGPTACLQKKPCLGSKRERREAAA